MKRGSMVVKGMIYGAGIVTVSMLVWIIGYLLIHGIPFLNQELFAWIYTSENQSLMPSLINTCYLVVGVLILAVPIGICSAIYLEEYVSSKRGLVRLMNRTIETLAAIPSIVYGLFGSIFFVTICNFNYSLLSAILTLAMMVLPLVIRTTQTALKEVDSSYKDASFALGAGKLRTLVKIVLPNAIHGILAGVILSIGRIIGESAAMIYTAGTVSKVAENLFSSTRTLSVHMYLLSNEGLHTNEAYATAVVLLLLVLLLNLMSTLVGRKIEKRS